MHCKVQHLCYLLAASKITTLVLRYIRLLSEYAGITPALLLFKPSQEIIGHGLHFLVGVMSVRIATGVYCVCQSGCWVKIT